MSFARTLLPVLQQRARQYPVVTVTGPRQAGKTTLCRAAFAHMPYANLERPDTRDFARDDPADYASHPSNAVILDAARLVAA